MGHKFGKAKAGDSDRRAFLQAAVAVATSAAIGGSLGSLTPAAAFTRAQRDQMTAEQIIATMQRGNERFRTGKEKPHNYLAQQKARATGQYPAAVILSCIDSRAPAETIMDLGIGDVFNARVAGNIANDDILGSLEFACQLAGAKVVLVMGHTACGAIKGAIDKAELGHLTGLLAKIRPRGGGDPLRGRTQREELRLCGCSGTQERRANHGRHSRSQPGARRPRSQGRAQDCWGDVRH
jgi:carbonic anhydrase